MKGCFSILELPCRMANSDPQTWKTIVEKRPLGQSILVISQTRCTGPETEAKTEAKKIMEAKTAVKSKISRVRSDFLRWRKLAIGDRNKSLQQAFETDKPSSRNRRFLSQKFQGSAIDAREQDHLATRESYCGNTKEHTPSKVRLHDWFQQFSQRHDNGWDLMFWELVSGRESGESACSGVGGTLASIRITQPNKILANAKILCWPRNRDEAYAKPEKCTTSTNAVTISEHS